MQINKLYSYFKKYKINNSDNINEGTLLFKKYK